MRPIVLDQAIPVVGSVVLDYHAPLLIEHVDASDEAALQAAELDLNSGAWEASIRIIQRSGTAVREYGARREPLAPWWPLPETVGDEFTTRHAQNMRQPAADLIALNKAARAMPSIPRKRAAELSRS